MKAAFPLELLQVTLVVRDLEAIVGELGIAYGLQVAFRDPSVKAWGLENAVLPMGTTFIELLSPVESDTPGGRQLERMGGDGGYMVILQTRALSAWRAHLERTRVRIVFEDETTDAEHGYGWAGFHLHPRDTGGMMISLDRPDPPDSWAGAGPDWRDFVVADEVEGLEGIELQSPTPERLAARWSEVLDRERSGNGSIRLDRGRVCFVPVGRGAIEGLAAVELRASDRARAGESRRIGGVDFRLI